MVFISFIVGLIVFAIFDYLWLAVIAKRFYLEALTEHVVIKDGSLVPYLPAIPLVYIVGCAFLWIFVVSRAESLQDVLMYGALAGFLLYAFYDLTNLATLKDYPWSITFIDILWGTFVMTLVAGVMFFIRSLMS